MQICITTALTILAIVILSSQETLAGIPTAMEFQLSLSAADLIKSDVLSESDPYCIVEKIDSLTNKSIGTLGQTAFIKDNPNPIWKEKVNVLLQFEEEQILRFSIFDDDGDFKSDDKLGSVDCRLSDIIGTSKHKDVFTVPLEMPENFRGKFIAKTAGTITIMAVKLDDPFKAVGSFKAWATNLSGENSDGTSDPYFEIHRFNQKSNKFVGVCQSAPILKNLNPCWPEFPISVEDLASSNLDRLLVRVIDKNRLHKDVLIGEVETTYDGLMQAATTNQCMQIRKKSGQSAGMFCMQVDFRDFAYFYLTCKAQMDLTIAVDFTASNFDPDRGIDLHQKGEEAKKNRQTNEYVLAIRSCGEIIQDYDYDKIIAGYGFGASWYDENSVVYDTLSINGLGNDPRCVLVNGFLDAYHKIVLRVFLRGPTRLTPIVKLMVELAKKHEKEPIYFILLVLTDGVIDDMDDTTEEIIIASSYAISIIIIGVGDAEFGNMRKLDSDGKLLYHKKKKITARRDIVQFVEMRAVFHPKDIKKIAIPPEIKNNRVLVDQYIFEKLKKLLSPRVLGELPWQFVEYMRKFFPLPNIPV